MFKYIVILSIVAVHWGGCFIFVPGDDPEGKKIMREANLVVEAVGKYKEAHGEWPSSLEDIEPFYRETKPDWELLDRLLRGSYHYPISNNHGLFYDKVTGRISFHYLGGWPTSVPTNCDVIPPSQCWECSGYL